ncbi:formate dehydrogenase accessory protein FdhE [Dokdonella sp.]|uniref:formate dehydrogenase accessory protein FdhE n=1 Tax=Dokdonella sp. TaxID=2291710 RepID=UPI001B1B7135|nr:formate dehydrogenase accessory protein FdhE [Dokdonella sp.]MBO9664571.1 formate dehydrogenase accessory protein FdhE [Dokdonella sp.]
MSQRILEPGQIETLAQRSIPRIRLPARESLFVQRAARLRALAPTSRIADYLHLCAAIADAQHAALAGCAPTMPSAAELAAAREHRMPPIPATDWPRKPPWRNALETICTAVAAQPGFPPEVARLAERVAAAAAAQLEAQADVLLGTREGAVDAAAAPLLVAALQVHGVAASSRLAAGEVAPLDVPGVCPLCGSLPVASVVRAQAQYQGYRYLHCALCACEWHLVRVQCSQCGASGKDIAYRSLSGEDDADDAPADAALRAETCDACHRYRKILYQEKDTAIEPVADDLASLALDLLLADAGYARASGNPLLWAADEA